MSTLNARKMRNRRFVQVVTWVVVVGMILSVLAAVLSLVT
jgi:hypothetical protein